MVASVIINFDSVTWVDIATLVGAFLTFGAIGAGVVVAWSQLSRQADIAQSEHLMDIVSQWGDQRLERARSRANFYDSKMLCEKLMQLGNGTDNEYYMLLRVPDFFEELGYHVFHFGETVTLKTASRLFKSPIMYYWELYEPFITWKRDQSRRNDPDDKDPDLYEWFGELYDKVKR